MTAFLLAVSLLFLIYAINLIFFHWLLAIGFDSAA